MTTAEKLDNAAKIGKRILDWCAKPVGAYMTQRIIVSDNIFEVRITPVGSFSEMQYKQAMESVKWIMNR